MKRYVKTAFNLALKDPELLAGQPWVNGQWVQGSAAPLAVFNPASGQKFAEVETLDAAGAKAAIAAAEAAFPLWRGYPARARAALLEDWAALITQHADDLARILTLEEGKPLAEAKAEILSGAAFAKWFAEEGKRVYGEIIP
ncbi:MAG: aldehyde dehydrogenase family protein, partial [Zoogloeaceae bacterium]|nr:aldehyde dehydrogenase family protein [Zoogloeaceae bacterium]